MCHESDFNSKMGQRVKVKVSECCKSPNISTKIECCVAKFSDRLDMGVFDLAVIDDQKTSETGLCKPD